MPDTGAPWNIPYAAPSDLVRDWPALSEDVAEAVADGLESAASFDSISLITSTNATWPVPSLAGSVVKVTVIGGGGGGGPGGNLTAAATAGGQSSFACSAGTATATGGAAGIGPNTAGPAGKAGFASGNGGKAGESNITGESNRTGSSGVGGAITVAYFDLTGVSTADVTIGAGGNGATGTTNGGAGGRGEVIVEYRAG
jgi:hypothetical protein